MWLSISKYLQHCVRPANSHTWGAKTQHWFSNTPFIRFRSRCASHTCPSTWCLHISTTPNMAKRFRLSKSGGWRYFKGSASSPRRIFGMLYLHKLLQYFHGAGMAEMSWIPDWKLRSKGCGFNPPTHTSNFSTLARLQKINKAPSVRVKVIFRNHIFVWRDSHKGVNCTLTSIESILPRLLLLIKVFQLLTIWLMFLFDKKLSSFLFDKKLSSGIEDPSFIKTPPIMILVFVCWHALFWKLKF